MKRSLSFIFAGIILFATILLTPAPESIGQAGWNVIAVIALMLIWWISEAVPIAVTALLPIVLFPVLEILQLKQVTSNYGHPIVFLFFGGFTIALAMEKWNLHKRIALSIVRKTGTNANGIILGFMIATAFLSMWLSNTATTVMMMPIAMSVLSFITEEKSLEEMSPQIKLFALSLVLGIAYAANIGGTATLTGTPPNTIFAGFLENKYDLTIDYYKWMLIGVPFALTMLILCWLILCFVIYPSNIKTLSGAQTEIEAQYNKLGKISYEEIMVLIVFLTTVFLWIFKSAIIPFEIKDSGIAVFAAIALFLIPRKDKKSFIMQWKGSGENNDMLKLPWNILLLFGGGLSIAAAMDNSGLVNAIGSQISSLSSIEFFGIIIICLVVTLLITELMSNLALITMFLPILAGISMSFEQNPLMLAIGATLASSCAFMLPMATPPNAIVFASGYIRIAQMVKAGIIMNIAAIILITILSYTLISSVFDIQPNIIPDWVNGANDK